MLKSRKLINWLGLLGVVSFASYILAVVMSPIAYPGYNWMSQAVSDLSAADAPSKELWNQLTSPYGVCGIVCVTLACIFVEKRLSKTLRLGVYLFALMNWVSYLGYSLFPLTTSGYAGTFQDIMHAVVTGAVVLLSIVSLILIMVGGYRDIKYRSIAVFATISLVLMFVGSIGIGLVPQEYFGVLERFSVFSATGFNAVLGCYIFAGIDWMEQKQGEK